MQNIIQKEGLDGAYFTVMYSIYFEFQLFFKKENENSVVRKCIVNQPMLLLGKILKKVNFVFQCHKFII